MADIQSTASGLWSAGSTWVGGTPPASADTVDINSGHTVTYDLDDEVTTYGRITISGGTLTFDNSGANRSIRCSDFYGISGTFNIGSSGTPWNSSYTAKILCTDTSGMFDTNGEGTINFYGATKTYYDTTLNGAGTATDTTITTNDTTGWLVGDLIAIQPTGNTSGDHFETEVFRIKAISTTTITLGLYTDETTADALAFGHLDNSIVLNLSHNIQIIHDGAGTTANWGGYRGGSTNNFYRVTFDNCSALVTGSSTTLSNRNNFNYVNCGIITNTANSNVGALNMNSPQFSTVYIKDCNFLAGGQGINYSRADDDPLYSTNQFLVEDSYFWGWDASSTAGGSGDAITGGDQPNNAQITGCHFAGFDANGFDIDKSNANMVFRDCYFYAIDDIMVYINSGNLNPLNWIVFENCIFNESQLGASYTNQFLSWSRYGGASFVNCKWSGSIATPTSSASIASFKDFNQTSGDDRLYVLGGYFQRDSTTKYATSDSLKFVSLNSGFIGQYLIKVHVSSTATKTIGIRGKKSSTSGWTVHPYFFVVNKDDGTISSEATFSDVDTNWNQKTTTISATDGDYLIIYVSIPYNSSSDFNIDDVTIT